MTRDVEDKVLAALLASAGASNPAEQVDEVECDEPGWVQFRLWLLRFYGQGIDYTIAMMRERWFVRVKVYEVVSAYGGISEYLTLHRRFGVPDLEIVEVEA